MGELPARAGAPLPPAVAVAPRRRFGSLTTRALAALGLLALAVMAALAYLAYDQDRVDQARAVEGPRRIARIAAAETAQQIEEIRHVLEFLTGAERRPSNDPERLCAMFPQLGPDWLAAGSFVVARVDGTPLCSTHVSPEAGRALAERDWFRRIVAGKSFAVGAPRAGPKGERNVAGIAVPVRDTQDALVAVLSYGIDLDRFVPPILYTPPTVEGRTVAYLPLDGSGAARLRDRAAADAIVGLLATAGEGRFVAPGATAGDLVYGFAKIPNAEWAVVIAEPRAGLPAGDPWRRHLVVGVLLGAALLVVAVLLWRTLRPLDALAETARRLDAGDGTPRAARHGSGAVTDATSALQALHALQAQKAETERKLRRHEDRYAQLLATTQEAVLVLDRALNITFANGAAQEMFGHAPAQLPGTPMARLLAPGALDRVLPGPREAWLSGDAALTACTAQVDGVRAGGEAFPLALSCSVRRSDGEPVVVVCGTDLSAHRNGEQRLRESEAQFRALSDSSPAMVWRTDATGGCVYVNPAWTAYTGRTFAQERGDGWNASVSRHDLERRRKAMATACGQRTPLRLECRRANRDGAYRWFVEAGAPWYDGAGQFAGLIGTSVDIHERAIAMHRMRRLAEMQSVLLHVGAAEADPVAPRAFFQRACDLLLQCGGCNAAWIALLDPDGLRARVVAHSGNGLNPFPQRPVRFDVPDDLAELPSMVALREGRSIVVNHCLEDPRTRALRDVAGDAELRSMAAFPLRMEGRVLGVLAVFSPEVEGFDEELNFLLEMLAANITAKLDAAAADARRTEAERALRQVNATLEEKIRERTQSVAAANHALEAANRELESFSYSVSHDLRAPLRSISGFSDLLQMNHGEALDDEARAYLDRIKAASMRMTLLINDLLNLSRIARAPLHTTQVDLSRIAEEALAHLVELEPARRVETRVEPDLSAHADPGLVAIALGNLLDNAWKFTARQPAAVIEFGHADIDGQVRYYVRDNGAGFDMAYADKLFAPFQRLHREADFAGTGIGLAIVQRIFARHGGKIWAESAPDRGATFWFTLGAQGPLTTPAGTPESA